MGGAVALCRAGRWGSVFFMGICDPARGHRHGARTGGRPSQHEGARVLYRAGGRRPCPVDSKKENPFHLSGATLLGELLRAPRVRRRLWAWRGAGVWPLGRVGPLLTCRHPTWLTRRESALWGGRDLRKAEAWVADKFAAGKPALRTRPMLRRRLAPTHTRFSPSPRAAPHADCCSVQSQPGPP